MSSKILIRRSLSNSVVTDLSNGEMAFTANGNVLFIGSPNGSVIPIAGLRTPGVLTANQALVANSTSGIDRIIVANLIPTTIWANGAAGTAGQILYSNGSAVYWNDPPIGDITAVNAGDGLIGGGTSGDVTINVGQGNGIVVDADTVRVLAGNGISVDSNGVRVNAPAAGGLVVNTTGTHVRAGNGISVDSNGVRVNAPASGGLVVNTTGTYVLAGTGVTVNATGVHIGQPVATTSNVTFANVVTGILSVTGNVTSNLMPSVNNTLHLGNTSLRWAQAHIVNIRGGSGIFDGSVEIGGDLIVSGNVTTTTVGSIMVGDAKILLAANNPGDTLDIGFSGTYNDGTQRYAGLFRDASENGIFRLFANTTQNLTTNNVINTTATGYTTAVLEAFLRSSGLFTNSSAVNITANSTVSVNFVANTLTLTTPLAATSGGTGLNTYTSGDLLVANTGNVLSRLALGTAGKILQSNGTAVIYGDVDGGTF